MAATSVWWVEHRVVDYAHERLDGGAGPAELLAGLEARAKASGEVAARRSAAVANADVTAKRVIRELVVVAFADLRDVAERGADWLRLRDPAELSDAAARAPREVVSTVSETELGTTRRLHVRQHDKIATLRELGKLLPVVRERVEVEHRGLADLFDEIRRRAIKRTGYSE